MMGLIKRDDPKLQASVASKHKVLLGSCLTAHASGASPSLGELPLRMHMCAMSLYLDVYRLLSCGASSDAEAFIRWRHAALTPSSAAATRASSAAPACILLMLPQASARAACAWLALSIGV